MITQEDLLKIEEYLKQRSIKDTMFNFAKPITGKEQIAIIQDGQNVRCSILDIVSGTSDIHVDNDNYINGSDITEMYAVPFSDILPHLGDEYRKKGIVVSFRDTDEKWKLMQYNGYSISNLSWLNLDNWNEVTEKGIKLSAKYAAGFDNTGSITKSGKLEILDGKVKGNELITLSALNDYFQKMSFNKLHTDDKSVIGSINELYDAINDIEPAENISLTLRNNGAVEYPLWFNIIPESSVYDIETINTADDVAIRIDSYKRNATTKNFFDKDETLRKGIIIPHATETRAGVITAEDYGYLKELFNKDLDVSISNMVTPTSTSSTSTLPYIKKLEDNSFQFDNRWLDNFQKNHVIMEVGKNGGQGELDSTVLSQWGSTVHSGKNALMTYDALESYINTQHIVNNITLQEYANTVNSNINTINTKINNIKNELYLHRTPYSITPQFNKSKYIILYSKQFKELDFTSTKLESVGIISIVYKYISGDKKGKVYGAVNYKFDMDLLFDLCDAEYVNHDIDESGRDPRTVKLMVQHTKTFKAQKWNCDLTLSGFFPEFLALDRCAYYNEFVNIPQFDIFFNCEFPSVSGIDTEVSLNGVSCNILQLVATNMDYAKIKASSRAIAVLEV